MAGRTLLLAAVTALGTLALSAQSTPQTAPLFAASDRCIACHNALVAPSGEDISIGSAWRPSMMANAARDPYWQAAVRREVTEHPSAQAEIEHECSACHMPMTRFQSKVLGGHGLVFGHLPVGGTQTPEALLAADGVSCSLCHQITADKLGSRESFVAGFSVDTKAAPGQRQVLGPYQVERGRRRIMHSATDFTPTAAAHLQSAEMCATCHTLFTSAIGPNGESAGELPEQVPYLEWKHSGYAGTQSCQSCHMSALADPVSITSVMPLNREQVSLHRFRGGNVFMARLLDRYRAELGVTAPPEDFAASIADTMKHLQNEAAEVTIENLVAGDERVSAEVVIRNLAGHKLPTAYPSRRVWLHVSISDGAGRVLFESGALRTDGSITGNDNDADGSALEPHHTRIDDSEEVQIYETVMADHAGRVTTGLLSAVRFIKDNRILPLGFAKETAPGEVAVQGGAREDHDFVGGSDRVEYVAMTGAAGGSYKVVAELWYQPIAFRWAHNLGAFDSMEPRRFVEYFESMAAESAVMLARAEARVAGSGSDMAP